MCILIKTWLWFILHSRIIFICFFGLSDSFTILALYKFTYLLTYLHQ